jgi:hypothetical protein
LTNISQRTGGKSIIICNNMQEKSKKNEKNELTPLLSLKNERGDVDN